VNPPEHAEDERFEALFTAHYAAVARFVARRYSGDDGGEVVAETFSTALRRLEDIPPAPMDQAWLFGVARRVLANRRRGDDRRASLASKISHERSLGPSRSTAEPDPAHVPGLLAIRQALESLSTADQELLLLSAWEELTPTEISVVLDAKPEVVRNRLTRARRRFAAAHQPADELPPLTDLSPAASKKGQEHA